jgi:hypothetical protein
MKIISSIILGTALAVPLAAQRTGSNTESGKSAVAGISLHYDSPQGDFANNVNSAFGAAGFFSSRLGSTPFAVRGDLSYSIYGFENRRVPRRTGPAVTITNNIVSSGLGLQAGLPGATVRPYVGGSVGFSYFFTQSFGWRRSQIDSRDFVSSPNYSDGTFATTLYGGCFIPLENGRQLDIGARYHRNGEARFLKKGDISFDDANNPVVSPRRSRADLLTIQIGFAFGRR